MNMKPLRLERRSDGYWRTRWTDESGVRHERTFGKDRDAAQHQFSAFFYRWMQSAELRNAHSLTVSAACELFDRHAARHYRRRDGTPTGEASNFRDAMRLLRDTLGGCPASALSPAHLRDLQSAMVESDLARTTVNARIARIVRVWRWLVSEGKCPAATLDALRSVDSLREGRALARRDGAELVPRESPPVGAVPSDYLTRFIDSDGQDGRPFVPRMLRAMVQVQLLTGMRPGELVRLRPIDIDQSAPVWRYVPSSPITGRPSHKTDRRQARVVLIGPRAQALLRPYLSTSTGATVFSPVGMMSERHMACKTHRTAQVERPRTARRVGVAYTVGAYAGSIRAACRVLAIPHFSPLQLRHNAEQAIQARFGVEAARTVLGHARIETTQLYGERDLAQASRVIGEVG